MSNIGEDFNIVNILTMRDLKLFLKDKVNVFFSMLAPLIVLVLYVLFLKKLQVDSLIGIFAKNGMDDVDTKLISGFLDGWLISGMLSIGCITVSLSANTIRVTDKTRGIVNDIIVSPVKQHLVKISYYLFNFIVTLFIMTIVFFISLIYIAASGTWHLSVGDVFATYGVLIFSVLSAVFFTSFITDFCKTEATLSAIVGIGSAVIGFIMGAYIPLAQMPVGVQYVAAIFPGTHSAGIMRDLLMTGPLDALVTTLPAYMPSSVINDIVEGLRSGYCLEINFFGKTIAKDNMALYMGITTAILIALNLLVHNKKKLDGDKKTKIKSK